MEFEWNKKKNKKNIEKHNLNFEEAKEIFDRPTLDNIDKRFNYGEVREINIGSLNDGSFITVVHTTRGKKTRIISARRSNKKERILYCMYYNVKRV